MVGVSLLSRECLVNDVEFINSVDYEEIMWMRVSSERGREALYIGCLLIVQAFLLWIVVMRG